MLTSSLMFPVTEIRPGGNPSSRKRSASSSEPASSRLIPSSTNRAATGKRPSLRKLLSEILALMQITGIRLPFAW